ncbi:amidase [Azorhizobium oxalatiphilum]|uniref:Amidase n=1 Tax=Azorhizobium oxalatiphilum TaxID=980631 RepID=A0A917FGB2_9HYPH|nr:amidase [Azorhizobium oxalatiphilum]GGF82633.1 amidase [Azorhizobium oxalatiphilum]
MTDASPSASSVAPAPEALAFASGVELLAALKAGTVTSRALLELYLARIARHNPALNAVIYMDADAARERADAADAARARGESWGPLHGLPMTVKESHHIAGWPTTWGDPALKDFRPDHTGVVAQRLIDAGAIIFGKTNVPINLLDWQTYNAIHGRTGNPWRADVTPGGSSGGSAAALAAGLTAIELGSDAGGSVRFPAHFCGVFGHRPSIHVVPQAGNERPGSTIGNEVSTSGPMARSAADLDLLMEVLAGPAGPDAIAWRLELPAPRARKLTDFRVAVLYGSQIAEVDESYASEIRALVTRLRAAGVNVNDNARPDFEDAEHHHVLMQVLRGAASGRATPAMVAAAEATLREKGEDDQSYVADSARALLQSHRAWLGIQERRATIQRAWATFFESYDVLLAPATTTAAFPFDEAGSRDGRTLPINGRQADYNDQLFWAGIATLSGLPASAAPIGQTKDGLPVGVQIVGPYLEDRTPIAFAAALEELHPFRIPPGFA